jgi:hypothetical protein
MNMSSARWLGGVALFASTLGISAYAAEDLTSNWINQRLREFDQDPKAFVNSPDRMEKYDPRTLETIKPIPKFKPELSGEGRDFLDIKDEVRQKIMAGREREGRAPIYRNDDPSSLVDQVSYTSLSEMDRANLTTSYLRTSPWSDDYWPIVTGVIAKRYADDNFPGSSDWAVNANYITRRSSCSLKDLSPAEKYDLLVGDSNWTLTHAMLAEGRGYYNSNNGKVEPWMGICHGWAPAAYMVPRPSQIIKMTGANGQVIPFYPSDIKALASLLWAKASPSVKFIGGRCNEKSPTEDQYGRVLSQNCFDTNPGTWHLAIVNQIGSSGRSFVFDATYDYEVWNQPVLGYEYSYFNPSTRTAARSLNEAMIDRRHFRNDVYSKHRSSNAAYVVGVAMKVVYIAETSPKHSKSDGPEKDKRVAVKYFYDLELDRNGNIVGGEWYQRNHPDFLFTPSPNAQAVSIGDEALNRAERWSGQGPMPLSWRRAAVRSSSGGQPLAKVVNTLATLSQIGE